MDTTFAGQCKSNAFANLLASKQVSCGLNSLGLVMLICARIVYYMPSVFLVTYPVKKLSETTKSYKVKTMIAAATAPMITTLYIFVFSTSSFVFVSNGMSPFTVSFATTRPSDAAISSGVTYL